MNRRPDVVYFGNKLFKSRRVMTVMETLEPKLAEFTHITTCSSIENKFLKSIDFLVTFFRKGIFSDKIIIDVFSTQNFYFAVALSTLSIIFNKKYILFLHGGNLPERYHESRKVFGYILKRAHCIVAPSDYLKLFFTDQGFRVVLIPNIFDGHHLRYKERASIDLNLIYIRGYGRIYNPFMAIRTLFEVKSKYGHVKLLMLGQNLDNNLEQVKELVSELGLDDNVELLEAVAQQEWVRLAEQYDIMISTPVIDNTPISILEGLSLGLYVVSTRVGGIPYLLEDKKNALLVRSNNHVEMASAIISLYQNEELRFRIRENSWDLIQLFKWEIIKPKWEKLLLEN